MAKLKLENVSKIYPSNSKKEKDVLAVSDFNLEIKDKEFIVFVGPSGCGKSTTLRMIAGLEENTKGNIYIDDELVNDVEPKYRNIAMVFQNYALYPHMSARENMSFGLKNMKVQTPKLDKDNNQIVDIDKKLLLNIKKEEKRTDSKIKYYEDLKKDISILKEEIEKLISLENKEKEINNKKLKLEKLENRYDENLYKIYLDKKDKIKEDYEYFSITRIPLYENKHLPKEEINKRVEEAAKTLDIVDLLDRKPKAMSGGQRQRVALGRALVRTPKIFLLDEPLSNLDAKLRTQMRVEIVNLYERLNTPFIYVTHDQVEAMSMGTRIVVMRKGIVQQIDSPTNLYDYPINRFVAGFLGSPQMNFLEIRLSNDEKNNYLKINDELTLTVPKKEMRAIKDEYKYNDLSNLILGIRSEDIRICENGDIKVIVSHIESLGSETLIYAYFPTHKEQKLIIKSQARLFYKNNEEISLKIDNKKIHLFLNEVGEKSILEGVKQ